MTSNSETSEIIARVYPVKCSNPKHPEGCPFGYYFVECDEQEAHAWIGNIVVGNCQIWGTSYEEGASKESATMALLARLAEGVRP